MQCLFLCGSSCPRHVCLLVFVVGFVILCLFIAICVCEVLLLLLFVCLLGSCCCRCCCSSCFLKILL